MKDIMLSLMPRGKWQSTCTVLMDLVYPSSWGCLMSLPTYIYVLLNIRHAQYAPYTWYLMVAIHTRNIPCMSVSHQAVTSHKRWYHSMLHQYILRGLCVFWQDRWVMFAVYQQRYQITINFWLWNCADNNILFDEFVPVTLYPTNSN